MTRNELINWICYWDRASNGPSLHKVHSLADMTACRMYNPCMQGGIMWDVTDAELWEALAAYRAMSDRKAA